LFWNVAGIGNKDREFWGYVRRFDLVSLCETWVDEKGWEGLKEKLPETHEWECSFAVKKKIKGRARGGFIIGKRKEWGGDKLSISKENEEMVMTELNIGKERWKVITVYGRQEHRKIGERIDEFVGEEEEGNIIVGGDFNIRIGELGGRSIEEGGIERYSKDKVIGNGGKQWAEWIMEKGWYILNGTIEGDWEGEYTYVGARGNSVIDYVAVNEGIRDRIRSFRIGEKIDSDHLPLEIEIIDEEGRSPGQEQEKIEEKKEIEIIIWDKEAIQKYKERTEELSKMEDQGVYDAETVEEKWEKVKRIVHGAMVRRKVRRWKKKEIGHKDWWDRSCTRKKREVKRAYRRWRKGKVGRGRFLEEKAKFKELVERRQKEKREEDEEELKKIKSEVEIWRYINKKRGNKTKMENKIGKEEWRKHFMNLLDGAEIRVRMEERVEEEIKDIEDMIEEEEIRTALRRMKLKKAAGIDGIPMEAWRHARGELWIRLVDLLRAIWKKGTIPKDWRKSIIIPLYKRGDKEKVGNYRGISLLCTAYKIYAEVLRNRLEKEAEEKNKVPESQAGFRKGRSTIDNIMTLYHIMQREKRKGGKNGKVYMLFADLKAAFDNVNRDILWEELKRKKIKGQLVGRMEKIYEETEVMVRTKQGYSEEFETKKGVRQGCVMSPILFNLYLADIDERLKERGIGGVGIGRARIWSLAYADDIVLVANNREAMQDMTSTFKRFLMERKLELCADKTKMLVFNRKRKERKEIWKWGDKRIEEVQTFKYLGFILNNKGNYKEHIKELYGKGRRAVRKVWGLGEKICRNDFRRRWILFRYLVQSVMAYGVEIWGWEEKEELEKVMLDYVRWIFGLDFCTPRYVITRELVMDKLRAGWGIRARRYEEKVKKGEAGGIVKLCWKEKEEYGWKDGYGREREKYYNRNGWGIEASEVKEGGEKLEIELINREREVQRQWKNSKIAKGEVQ